MSKILETKKWLTIKNAAKRLAILVEDSNEQVTEDDVMQLALEGYLKLSVNFVNEVYVRSVTFTGWEDGHFCILTPQMIATLSSTRPDYKRERLRYLSTAIGSLQRSHLWPNKENLNDDDEIHILADEKVSTISGVHDLLIIGGKELTEVENRYHQLTGGPAVTIKRLDGVFIESVSGMIYQLQEHCRDIENYPGSPAQQNKLKCLIANREIDEGKAKELTDKFIQDRKEFIANTFTRSDFETFFPARSLPKDAILGVRDESLLQCALSIRRSKPSISIEQSNSSETSQNIVASELLPWEIVNPDDPKFDYDWYTPARFFARAFVKEDSTLLLKREILANKVAHALKNAGYMKRGGKKPFNSATVKKAFSNVKLG